MPTTLPKPGKAAKRFKASEINHLLETGEMFDEMQSFFQSTIDEAEASIDGEVQVVFFVENDSDESEDEGEE